MKTLITLLILTASLGIQPKAQAALSIQQLKTKVEKQRTRFNQHYINPAINPNNQSQLGKLSKMLLHSRLQRFHANEVIQRKGLTTCSQALAEMPGLISGEYLFKKSNGSFQSKICTFDPTSRGKILNANHDVTPPTIAFSEANQKNFHEGEDVVFQFNAQDTFVNGFAVPSSGLSGGFFQSKCRWDSGPWQNCLNGRHKTNTLAPGPHKLTVMVKDAKGNTATAEKSFKVFHSNIRLSWSGLSAGHQYSIDFRRTKNNGELVTFAPCLDAGLVGTRTSYQFRRKCLSAAGDVSMHMLRSQIRVCAAYAGQWTVKGKVICTGYKDANVSSLHFDFPPRTGVVTWNDLGAGFDHRLDVRTLKDNGQVRETFYNCVNESNLGNSGSYRFERYCMSHRKKPVVSFNTLQVRICAAKGGKWSDRSKIVCSAFSDFRGGSKKFVLTPPR